MDEASLEAFLKFTDADLAANREGTFSSGQERRIAWSGAWRLVLGPPIAITGVVVAFATDLAFIMAGGLLILALGLWLTWRGFAFLTDRIVARVAYVTAPMHRKLVRGRYGDTYFAVIGPVSKRVSRAAYNALRVGPSCHLYYAPACRSLLSLEPASAAEPKPEHPFGPDSAHTWNRLRWSWVAMTIGVAGLVVGAHAVVVAHPAYMLIIQSRVTDYVETHGKSTVRHLYVAGYGNPFTPDQESAYDPPAPPYSSLIGEPVLIYVDRDTGEILALNAGDTLHSEDWFRHPEHKTVFEAVNGAITAGLSLLAFVGGAIGVAYARRRVTDASRPLYGPLFGPPSVHQPMPTLLVGLGLLGVVVLTLLLVLVSARP